MAMATQTSDDREDRITLDEPATPKADINNSGELAKLAASSQKRTVDTPLAPIDEFTGPRKMPDPGMRVVSGPEGSAPYHPTISLDPGNAKGLPHFEEFERDLQPVVSALSEAFEGLKLISNAREQLNKDTSKTEEQKLLIVAGRAEKAFDQMLRNFDQAHKNLRSLEKALDESLSKPLEQQAAAGNNIPSEIRAYSKRLPNEERSKFIADAMKDGDSRTLTSILGAPAYLSGLSNEMQKTLTRQYHEASNPVVVRRLVATRAAIEMIEKRSGLVFTEMPKAMRGTFEQVKKLRGQVEASERALAAIGGV